MAVETLWRDRRGGGARNVPVADGVWSKISVLRSEKHGTENHGDIDKCGIIVYNKEKGHGVEWQSAT